jgi:hypothetical protein
VHVFFVFYLFLVYQFCSLTHHTTLLDSSVTYSLSFFCFFCFLFPLYHLYLSVRHLQIPILISCAYSFISSFVLVLFYFIYFTNSCSRLPNNFLFDTVFCSVLPLLSSILFDFIMFFTLFNLLTDVSFV